MTIEVGLSERLSALGNSQLAGDTLRCLRIRLTGAWLSSPIPGISGGPELGPAPHRRLNADLPRSYGVKPL
jgi:hypothetical protein